jgi:hypothetical protein
MLWKDLSIKRRDGRDSGFVNVGWQEMLDPRTPGQRDTGRGASRMQKTVMTTGRGCRVARESALKPPVWPRVMFERADMT